MFIIILKIISNDWKTSPLQFKIANNLKLLNMKKKLWLHSVFNQDDESIK